jgi:hypothetical protein
MTIQKRVLLGIVLPALLVGAFLSFRFILRADPLRIGSMLAGTHLVTLTLEDKRVVRLLTTVTDDGTFVTSANTSFGTLTGPGDVEAVASTPQQCSSGVRSPFSDFHGTGHGTWTREGINGVWMALYFLYDGCGNFAGYMRAGGKGPLYVPVHSGPTYIDIFGPDDDPIAGVPRKHLTGTFVTRYVPSAPVMPKAPVE